MYKTTALVVAGPVRVVPGITGFLQVTCGADTTLPRSHLCMACGNVVPTRNGYPLCFCCSEIVEYVNNKMAGGPLGGSDVDQQLAARWAEKTKQWDGNLFLAGGGSGGEHTSVLSLQPQHCSCS